jgi:glycosyltransferase involved in cell wall biosynthesis
MPKLLRSALTAITGIAPHATAAPSAVRRAIQLYVYNQFATLSSVYYACRLAARNQRAIVHLLCPPSSLTLACANLTSRITTRIVITTFASSQRFTGTAFIRWLCRRRAVTINVQTKALAEEWSSAIGDDLVCMIPLPFGTCGGKPLQADSRRILGLPDGRPIIGIIGCIGPEKGYIEFFRAISPLPRTFRVLLIGDTPSWVKPHPTEVVREAGWLNDTILRLQFVPEHLMPCVFGAIDAVALLYRQANASSGVLSWCREYGVPVLATDHGEIGAAVRRDRLGVTVDPDNTEEVRAGVTQLMSGRCSVLVSAEVANAEPLTWAEAARAHVELYSALSGRPQCNAGSAHPEVPGYGNNSGEEFLCNSNSTQTASTSRQIDRWPPSSS